MHFLKESQKSDDLQLLYTMKGVFHSVFVKMKLEGI